MSKRNFILLIIILAIIVVGVFGFLYFQQPTTPGGDTTGINFGSKFNPFGSNNTTTPPITTPPVDVSGYIPSPATEIKLQLTKVSTMPIAGYAVFFKERLKGEFMPALRYVARADGNIYQTFADKILEQKFSKTIIPKIYEAFFGNNGGSVIMRYLKGDNKTIATFVGTLPKETLGVDPVGDNEIKGVFLPDDIKDISLLPDGSSTFYLFNVGDNTVGTTLNFVTNKKAQIFDSAFNEWLSVFSNTKTISLTTKPASSVLGYMYTLNTSNKNFTKTLGGINGLTTLTSPDGKLVLYSDNNLSLNVYHTDTKVSDTLGVNTLAEKCVWNKTSDMIYCGVPQNANGGNYPETWYQGEISFSDQIWKIDAKIGSATIIADPITISGGEDIDSIKLSLDDGENYLFFVNKKDSYLWELKLK